MSARVVLYQGLHFSKYDTLVSVLENEFEGELPAPLPDMLAPILLSNKAIQATFDNNMGASFSGSGAGSSLSNSFSKTETSVSYLEKCKP